MLDTAKSFGLEVVAITDHDTVSGIDEAIQYGKKIGIKVIPGIEITSSSGKDVKSLEKNTRIDVLGYKIDWNNKLIEEFYEKLLILKKEWTKDIVKYLNKKGYHLDFDSLTGYSEVFIIRQIIEKGYCENRFQAKKIVRTPEILSKYPYIRPSLKKTIDLILKVGGIPVLAHAYRGLGRKSLSDQQVSELISVMKSFGLMGIETHHYFHLNGNKFDKLLKICRKENLIPTIGSDHHSSTVKYKGISDDDKRICVFNIINHDFNEIIQLCLTDSD